MEQQNPCSCGGRFGDYVLNMGRVHFAVCDYCQHYWAVGSNLFSSWREETEADWMANEAKLASMQACDCKYLPGLSYELRQLAIYEAARKVRRACGVPEPLPF